jgi:transposase-like protein
MSTAITPGLDQPSTLQRPTCPFCGSEQVATKGNIVADTSYWRCWECGQMWNPLRHRLALRH